MKKESLEKFKRRFGLELISIPFLGDYLVLDYMDDGLLKAIELIGYWTKTKYYVYPMKLKYEESYLNKTCYLVSAHSC